MINPAKIKSIVVVRNDRFGEFLLNIPAFRALKETFPGARLVALVSPQNAELAQHIPCIDEIIAWQGNRLTWAQKFHLANTLRSKRPDLAIILYPSKDFNIVAFLAGIPNRVGYDHKWPFLLTRRMPDRKAYGERHEVDYNLELVALAGAKSDDKSLAIKIDDDIISSSLAEFGLNSGEILIGIHPFTSDSVKLWPAERFLSVAKKLLSKVESRVLIFGGAIEQTKAYEAFSGYPGIINLTGKTTLVQLAALLKKCRVLISGDSGPVHLASCVGTPVVALFRNDLPGKGPKRWGPLSVGSIVIEKADLSEISADEVVKKSMEAIGKLCTTQ